MNTLTLAEPVRNPEVVSLARAMGTALREMVLSYQQEERLTTLEAVARVREDLPERQERALHCPAPEVSWPDLESLLEHDPEKYLHRWEEIKQAARDELLSGHRAAELVEMYGSTPWQRARFLALRLELADGWQPRNGVERQLVDTLAQAQTAADFWWKRVMSKAAREAAMEQDTPPDKGKAEPAQGTGFQTVEQAGVMVERFNRIFLRTLRVLQDLRRRMPAVIVQNVGHVNIGEQQAKGRIGNTHAGNGAAAAALPTRGTLNGSGDRSTRVAQSRKRG
jgi:hypothetical protein